MSKARGAVLTGQHFMNGDTAAAEGALAAGCTFFGGYPITPATEVAERMSERLPDVGGIYIQMEDEIASMGAILGAAWGGRKSMTSTSGPGFSLMMENIGLGVMTETPCVIVNVQRGGPSTGLPTLVGQQDMMQARWGSHGDYEIIALCPNSPQECFDLTIEAFNLSERYRVPVFVMTDEVVGHMTEKVTIPSPDKLKIVPRRITKEKPGNYMPYVPEKDLVPAMVAAGNGYRIHITGLTHDERGYPAVVAPVQAKTVPRLIEKIRQNAGDIVRFEEDGVEDAEVVIVSYGITSRVALMATEMAREKGVKVGFFRLIVAWPFPEARIRELAGKVKGFVVPEINLGQMVYEVERCAAGKAKTVLVPHAGGAVHDPAAILSGIEEALR
ncbi:2-oxoacid:acceptor oxidoreductase subunit alpha [Candidatus Eisenbacteria bacterium]|uniref:2-oxoacid:acceptor oxidoreductase subunit alpha n=1 Tax=Eiseniibacteriota bacterium TaxID=2212470 RepID=A0ABV6YIC2_UNCEI